MAGSMVFKGALDALQSLSFGLEVVEFLESFLQYLLTVSDVKLLHPRRLVAGGINAS